MDNVNPVNPSETSAACGAKLRNRNANCKNRAVMTNGRCRNHGGLTPKGIASPNYKHGRYSKHLPNHLRDRYNESLSDPELTALRDDLALIDVQIGEALSAVYDSGSEGGSGVLLEKIKVCRVAVLEKDLNSSRVPDLIQLLDEFESTIESGTFSTIKFSQLQPLLEQRRKTSESENRRVYNSNNCLTVEQAIAFVRQLGEIVKLHVKDPIAVRAISEDFARALNR